MPAANTSPPLKHARARARRALRARERRRGDEGLARDVAPGRVLLERRGDGAVDDRGRLRRRLGAARRCAGADGGSSRPEVGAHRRGACSAPQRRGGSPTSSRFSSSSCASVVGVRARRATAAMMDAACLRPRSSRTSPASVPEQVLERSAGEAVGRSRAGSPRGSRCGSSCAETVLRASRPPCRCAASSAITDAGAGAEHALPRAASSRRAGWRRAPRCGRPRRRRRAQASEVRPKRSVTAPAHEVVRRGRDRDGLAAQSRPRSRTAWSMVGKRRARNSRRSCSVARSAGGRRGRPDGRPGPPSCRAMARATTSRGARSPSGWVSKTKRCPSSSVRVAPSPRHGLGDQEGPSAGAPRAPSGGTGRTRGRATAARPRGWPRRCRRPVATGGFVVWRVQLAGAAGREHHPHPRRVPRRSPRPRGCIADQQVDAAHPAIRPRGPRGMRAR